MCYSYICFHNIHLLHYLAHSHMTKKTNSNEAHFELDVPLRERAQYPRALAEAGMFNLSGPEKGKEKALVEETYHLADKTIYHRGPWLTLHDEDTLIAILQLCQTFKVQSDEDLAQIEQIKLHHSSKVRQMLLPGKGGKSGSDSTIKAANMIEVALIGTMSIYNIQNYLGLEWGGESKGSRWNSLSKLSETLIAIEKFDENLGQQTKTSFEPLIQITEIKGDNDRIQFIVRISDAVKSLLSDYIKINLSLRNKLGAEIGKSLHRYLSVNGFPSVTDKEPIILTFQDMKNKLRTSTEFSKLKERLVYKISGKKPNQKRLPGPLQILKEVEFIGDFDFGGAGRRGNPNFMAIYPPGSSKDLD